MCPQARFSGRRSVARTLTSGRVGRFRAFLPKSVQGVNRLGVVHTRVDQRGSYLYPVPQVLARRRAQAGFDLVRRIVGQPVDPDEGDDGNPETSKANLRPSESRVY